MDPIAVLTSEELQTLIRAAVRCELANREREPARDVLTTEQVRDLLGCSQPSLRKLLEAGLPVRNIPGLGLRFSRAEVCHWFAQQPIARAEDRKKKRRAA